jgi:ubiquitin C-terminal hydrolase
MKSLFDARYRLSAVIEHFGSALGGHYVAYKKLFPSEDGPGSWVVADDNDISIIREKEVLNRCAYMLFYEKIVGCD